MSIIYYSQPKNDFSDLYLKVRRKENRLLSEEEIRRLPDFEKKEAHNDEWQLRKKSATRFTDYLRHKNRPLKILDVGCGNGWFSHLMSNINNTEVIGLDINTTELEQADSTFQKENLTFVYANIFEKTELHQHKFDIIVFNSCLQYFDNLTKLFQVADYLLTQNGEIHSIDTPFYNNNSIVSAKKRSQIYYESLGFPEMAKNYFHHRFDDLGKHKIMYKQSLFSKYFKKDSPFCWILIQSH
ncbi:hypothetical protein FEDK69T_13100 [Flavobacterium enshiense DK69]|uniref:Methyltransferase domain-containing protein n=1 Tax=Flavobacterium enshiense DK69 TaxID=1107311 RepID=V6S9R5_9FLAO|nr:methyltransferase domain-containing protein [Flavobacterium enshiense]ESU23159.1 hypothetical protein FEDK69T_13100 [Flavobacterium enshiense DK69]KGO95981.1 hypothetical protein Q767_06865 [Flavobacterium enshiense DK69]